MTSPVVMRAQCLQPIMLNNWTAAGGTWTVNPGGTSVFQSVNGTDVFFLSPNDYINCEMFGNFMTLDGDNDVMGFVFGVEGNIAGFPTHYYRFSWDEGGVGNGMFVHEITKTGATAATTTITPLFSLPGSHWTRGFNHQFRLIYASTYFQIYIDGSLVTTINGCFNPGKFGFYNYSQARVTYSNFQTRIMADFVNGNNCIGLPTNFHIFCNNPAVTSYTSITWDMGNGAVLNNNQHNFNYTYPAAGTYSVKLLVADMYNCRDSITKSVTIYPLPVVTANSATICLGQQTASLSAGGALSYTWTPAAQLSATIGFAVASTATANTVYTVTGTDANSCVSSQTSAVTVNPLPLVSVNNASICLGQQTATLTAAGAFAYSWLPAAGLGNTAGSVVLANPTVATTYTVTGTDANGCRNNARAGVGLYTLPVIAGNSAAICSGQQTASLVASGGNTYAWSPTVGLSSATASSVTATPSVTTNYTLTGTDLNGCYDDTVISVQVYAIPTLSVNPAAICAGQQTATLTVSGSAAVYSWAPNTGLSAATGSVVIANPASTTHYTVQATDINGCYNSANTPVTVHSIPAISVNGSGICAGQQTASLTATGSSTYSWTPAAGLSATTGSIVLANPNASTTYSVQGTDLHGCVSFTNTNVMVWTLPLITAGGGTICAGQQTVTVNAGGAMSYTWFPAAGLNSATGATVSASPGATTTYTVSGTDSNGCVNDTATTIVVKPLPQAVFNYTNACINAQPVFLDAVGSSIAVGTNTLYSWNYGDGSAGTGISASHAYSAVGTYTASLTVTSDFGCTSVLSRQTEVYQKPLMSISAGAGVCFGAASSFTAISLAGSGTVVSWLWDVNNSLNSAELTGQSNSYAFPAAGSQTLSLVTVTDHNCRDTLSRTVYVNHIPAPAFSADRPAGCPLPHCVNFTDLTPAIPLPAKLVQWDWDFGNGESIGMSTGIPQRSCYSNTSDSQTALYSLTLTVSTDSGCVASEIKPAFITVYPKPVASYTTQANLGNVLVPQVQFVNQSTGYSAWKWSFGDGPRLDSVNRNPEHYYPSADAGKYHSVLIVANSYGCTDTAYALVEIAPEFAFYVPNAFSPNGDGINDVFTGVGMGIEDYEMWIFDRWGAMIYHTNDISQGWDGGNDSGFKQEVYVWKIFLKDVSGVSREYTGHVTLLR